MYLKRLKGIRIAVSLLFFVPTAMLFLDFGNWFAPGAGTTVLFLQFVPSFLKFIIETSLVATGFIFVLLMALFAGRVYCSTVCPLGTIQDLAGFISRKRKNRTPARYRQPHTVLRFLFLFLTVFLLLAGNNVLLNILDPFSTFGRIMTNVIAPIGTAVNNGTAMILEKFGTYALAREQWAVMAPLSLGIAGTMLMLVLWMASSHGRLYCNTVCPVGTLLGVLAKYAVVRLHINTDACTYCRRCEAVCKAGCINLAEKTIDMSRCVSCFNCLAICKTNGIRFAVQSTHNTGEKKHDPQKRLFLSNSILYLFTFAGLAQASSIDNKTRKIIQSQPTTIPVVMTSPVSPPGSISITHFTAVCTACHLCVSACPAQILLPSVLQYGPAGLMQPRMSFKSGHCNYECTICSDVCPTGAIRPLAVEEKKLTQIGVAKFIKKNCVVYTDNTACGACSEHCPTKAVKMVPYANPLKKSIGIPEINKDYCIGCGGCEHACPTKPYKAIFVDGNPSHRIAKRPITKKIDQKVDFRGDFPF